MRELSKSDKKNLKALAHHLKPVAQIGKDGVSDSVLKTINEALNARELIKVQLLDTAFLDRKLDSIHIAELLNASLVQVIGNRIVLYRENREKTEHLI